MKRIFCPLCGGQLSRTDGDRLPRHTTFEMTRCEASGMTKEQASRVASRDKHLELNRWSEHDKNRIGASEKLR